VMGVVWWLVWGPPVSDAPVGVLIRGFLPLTIAVTLICAAPAGPWSRFPTANVPVPVPPIAGVVKLPLFADALANKVPDGTRSLTTTLLAAAGPELVTMIV